MADEETVPKDCDEIKTAVKATSDTDKGRQRVLIQKAIEFGCVGEIPESWEVEIHE